MADELFPKQQGEYLMGEDSVDMRMEVDAVAEGLDHSHHSWHDLKACGCVQEFHKCAHRRETKRIEEPLEIIEEHPVENRVFRMTLAVDPCHGREDDSQNGPDYGRRPCTPDVPGMIESANLSKNVNKR